MKKVFEEPTFEKVYLSSTPVMLATVDDEFIDGSMGTVPNPFG